jgi:hypothetical protein
MVARRMLRPLATCGDFIERQGLFAYGKTPSAYLSRFEPSLNAHFATVDGLVMANY